MLTATGCNCQVNLGEDYSAQDIRVSFTTRTPSPVLYGDLLLFQAPPGFPMSEFQWEQGPEEAVPRADIACHFGPCNSESIGVPNASGKQQETLVTGEPLGILALSFSSSWQLSGERAYSGAMTFSVASTNPQGQMDLGYFYFTETSRFYT